MALKTTPLAGVGDIRGVIYDFEQVGDILPKHNHYEDTAHITIVARGRLRAYSHDWSLDADAGQVLDFRSEEPHEFMALADNTRIVNIIKKFGGHVDDTGEVA